MVTLVIEKGVHCIGLPDQIKQRVRAELTMENPAYKNAIKYGRYIGPDTKPLLKYYAEDHRGIIYVPRGYIWRIKKILFQTKTEHEVLDKTLELDEFDFNFTGKPRDYQREAINKMISYPVGVLESGTGSGKTFMAISLIALRKQPTLVIVHTKELLYQWEDAISQFMDGYKCGLIGDGKNNIKEITVGIINSVSNKVNSLSDKFGHIIIDECFPAGTLIDGKPIEEIKIGDYVNSFNHNIGKLEKKKVTFLFKKKPETLCTVKLKNGKEIICTENHPFYTSKGYLTASELNDSISVLSIDEHQNYEEKNGKSDNESLLCMWKNSRMPRKETLENFPCFSKIKQCEMLRCLCTKKNKRRTKKRGRIFKRIQQSAFKSKNEGKQSDAQKGKYCSYEISKTCKWYSECLEWNKRGKREYNANTKDVSNSFGMGDGSTNSNSRPQTERAEKDLVQKEECSYVLQSRCREHGIEGSSGDRWEESCRTKEEIRQKERKLFKMERVESVTFHKRTSKQGFGKLCKDGYVYNIEIEDNHNYFVGGVLVHNCHRCPSKSWTDTLQKFPAKRYLGLTATAYRNDGLGNAIPLFIGPIRHRVDKKMLQRTGAVLKPDVYRIRTNFWYDYRNDYTTMMKDLAVDVERNRLIANTIMHDLKKHGSPILCVSDRVKHLEIIEALLKSKGIKCHVLSGSISTGERKKIVSDLKTGKVKVLIATLSLIGEGFDAPNLHALFLMMPVKFEGRLIQSVGRILRPEKNKKPRLYDFRDMEIFQLRNSGFMRDKIYKKEWA